MNGDHNSALADCLGKVTGGRGLQTGACQRADHTWLVVRRRVQRCAERAAGQDSGADPVAIFRSVKVADQNADRIAAEARIDQHRDAAADRLQHLRQRVDGGAAAVLAARAVVGHDDRVEAVLDTSGTMSSLRSRSGGISIETTLRR